MKPNFRIGYGFDVHQFVSGRKLILGGIEIPNEKGLLGHSDADALLHSITDAILGAAALGDIGSHFPDTDPQYKNADSKFFVKEANRLINEIDYEIANVDSTIVLQKPKLRPYIDS
ncbi:MAG: 2-C-methyl-D-erythritol 2,4-cyclodiphosphate synthase, partial [bacterium]